MKDYEELERGEPIQSWGVRKVSKNAMEQILDRATPDSVVDLLTKHAEDSEKSNSPFISLTTRKLVALQFASRGKDPSDMIITVKTKRAIPNPFNTKGENEYVVPLYIRPDEIVKKEYTDDYDICNME